MSCNLSILTGDCREVLKTMQDESVHCCVTSPPYWGLRDYGVDGQLGLEKTPEEYVAQMVAVFREVRRLLRNDGTLWLNIGDSYVSGGGSGHQGKTGDRADRTHTQEFLGVNRAWRNGSGRADGVVDERGQRNRNGNTVANLKPKDLCGIPWRLAFALQSDGWYLRQDIIWHKPNPMPESVTDRCTKAHEYLFLLSKSARYHYDAEAIRENGVVPAGTLAAKGSVERASTPGVNSRPPEYKEYDGFRNKRSVWTVATAPYAEAHFATFPPALIKPCILAGCPAGGTVLDPFGGSGTTGQVALELGRSAILIELNPEYVKLANHRTNVTYGLALTYPGGKPQP